MTSQIKPLKTAPLRHQKPAPLVIAGRVARPQTPANLRQAGITFIGNGSRVSVQLGGETHILRQARLITRPSGRKRHLSRYLTGICTLSGQYIEIFIETISGLRQALYKGKARLQKMALRWLAQGLNPRQRMEVLL